MPSRLKTRHLNSVLILGVSVTLLFQNCSQPMDPASSSSFSLSDGMPFGFQATLDTISYMSCSEIKAAVEPRAYFSYRAGAYTNYTSGLTLTDLFRQTTVRYENTQRAQVLADGGNALFSLSIRS